jgi:hypothetical protein
VFDFSAIEKAGLFAAPPVLVDADNVTFYHTIEIPGHGLMKGDWDLRADIGSYLGHVDHRGRSILDIGTSNGFLAFEMERRGGRVVTTDLPIDGTPDIFPISATILSELQPLIHTHVKRTRNTFWLAHKALNSSVRLVESNVCDLDPRITGFDVAIIGNVMQHLRDPIGMLLDIADRAQTVVVTEADWRDGALDDKPIMELCTSAIARGTLASWFMVSPRLVEDILTLKGFSIVAREIHRRPYTPNAAQEPIWVRHYTVTATKPAP